MAPARFTFLPSRGILRIGGDDRRAFLQGLVSNDVNKLAPDRALWSAFLTPQGKFLHEFFLSELGDAFLVEGEAERLEDLRKRLSMYKLRSKVTVEALPEMAVAAVFDGTAFGLPQEVGACTAVGDGVAYVDPRLAAAGIRVVLPRDGQAPEGLQAADFADYDRHRIALGLPDGSRDMLVDKAILLENGFDELHGVDWQKGCYMGQELTARTKYRGLIKKRLVPVRIDGPAPAPGTILTAGDAEAGEMRSSCGDLGLALVRLDHLEAALTAGEATLTPMKPAWLALPG